MEQLPEKEFVLMLVQAHSSVWDVVEQMLKMTKTWENSG